MTNDINTIKSAAGLLAKAAAAELVDNLKFCSSINQADASDYKGKNGYSAGDTIYINKPFRPTVGTTSFDLTSSLQDIKEEKVPLTLDVLGTVGVALDSQELASTVDVKSVYNRVVSPAVKSIAQSFEQTMLSRAALATAQGALITDVTGAACLAAGQVMQEQLCPSDDMNYILGSPSFTNSAVTQRSTLFNASSEISKQYKNGMMGQADGFNWMRNNLLPSITTGNDVTGVAVNDAAAATGATTLAIDGLTNTTGTVNKGQQFTIAGVYAVHPITKAVMTTLQNFVATADATANGSGQVTISIYPAIYGSGSGSLQNVSALPADNAALTFVGAASTTYRNSLAFHKDAYTMVSVPLVLPDNAEFAAQETYKGVTVAIVRAWDQLTRRMITRVDVLGGFAATRPEWAYRFVRTA